ncbi:MAG: hypothetical protein E7433_05160 [Ruminococcaceae bacterium]|nr:hypothetical protein [Oscillospiraceae bacterium]
MEIPLYLAMTAAEFTFCPSLPERIAWMACHFSPYGTGLSGIPDALPPESIVIVNDRIPVCGHDPSVISSQLQTILESQQVCGILLDFQRPDCPQAAEIAAAVTKNCSCPVAVSELYAVDLPCAVFLSPVPANKRPTEHFEPWSGREIWLEAALEGVCIHLDFHGSAFSPMDYPCADPLSLFDPHLHSHYRMDISEDSADFYIQRTKDDLTALLQDAKAYNVTKAIGLYQELRP